MAVIFTDSLGQEIPRVYEIPDETKREMRRNIPALQNTNLREEDADFLQQYSEISNIKSQDGKMNDLIRQYQMNYKPYQTQDQFNLQSSTNAFYRTLPPDLLNPSYRQSSSQLSGPGNVSDRAYAPSANYRGNYANYDALNHTNSHVPRPDFPVHSTRASQGY